jgi:hypothetical protein
MSASKYILVGFVGCFFATAGALAQDGAAAPTGSFIITGEDMLSSMPPDRRAEYQDLQQKGRDLQRGLDAVRDIPDAYAGLLPVLEAAKTEFQEKFGELRGIADQNVIVYGDPPPSAGDIIGIVLANRRNSQDGNVPQHWYRDTNGNIIGGGSAPAASAVAGAAASNGQGYGYIDTPISDFDIPCAETGCGDIYGIPSEYYGDR